MALGVSDFLHLIRTVDRLLALEKKHGDLIEALDKEVRSLSSRIARLETREDILITEAKAAAAAAASIASTAHLTDLARHIGILEERTSRIDGHARNLILDGASGKAGPDSTGTDVLHNS